MENMLNKEVSIQIKKHLKNMVNGVKIILFTQKNMSNCVHCDETEKLLSEISDLSSKIIVEKKIAPIIVTASSLNSFAVSPSKKTIGIKIQIKTIDVEIIAKKTSFEPCIAASVLGTPDSIFL